MTKSILAAGPALSMAFFVIMPCGMWTIQSLLQKSRYQHRKVISLHHQVQLRHHPMNMDQEFLDHHRGLEKIPRAHECWRCV